MSPWYPSVHRLHSVLITVYLKPTLYPLLLMEPRDHGAWTHALCHPRQKTVPNIKFNFQFKIIKNENKGLMPLVVAVNGKLT